MRIRVFSLLLGVVLVACARASPTPTAPRAAEPAVVPRKQDPLELGLQHLAASRYSLAEKAFRAELAGSRGDRARSGLVEVLNMTGRYREAIELSNVEGSTPSARAELRVLRARALRRLGRLPEAERLLSSGGSASSGAERLLLGEVLLEQGRRREAEPVLMSLVEDYNEDRIPANDGLSLARVARAAHLLRSPQDANELFNQAEQATPGNPQILLWRGELYLEKYNPGKAEEVALEVLKRAPEHPEANLLLAGARLAQSLDFEEAERLARKALAVNPSLSKAYFWLGATALRDGDFEEADRRIARGLDTNPRQLELLSLLATVRFLADDEAGFAREKARVLKLNPEYTKLYQILADFADWEHRYDEIVSLMREALAIDSEDAKAEAQLGLNLIRGGRETEGVSALQSAFDMDPYNVRVFNTLNLYEEVIAQKYESASHKGFRIRYPRQERAILERYVPQLLDAAWAKLTKRYGFVPETPVGIEIYAERESFAVRTSGLPRTAIQGVCFGKTLAALSPAEAPLNLGMTLWHELSHVFHIQMSRSRVPRWLTEGLAEYETLIERPEWAREHDPDLFRAARAGRLPSLVHMTRAFTRAEQVSDLATAYYASSVLVQFLAERYGFDRIIEMLKSYGESLRTEAVFTRVLGRTAAELDQEFRTYLDQRLSRYKGQFLPSLRQFSVQQASERLNADRRNPKKQLDLARALLEGGSLKQADEVLAAVEKARPADNDARYLRAQWQLAAGKPEQAKAGLKVLLANADGFDVQMLWSEVADALGDEASRNAAYAAAHRQDPTRSKPLFALWAIARRSANTEAEIEVLEKLAKLEQHTPDVYKRLLQLLNGQERFTEAVEVGEAAVNVDMEGLWTHLRYGRALRGLKRRRKAKYELESAAVCAGSDEDKALVHVELAALAKQSGDAPGASRHAATARKLAETADAVTTALDRLGL